MQVYLGIDLGGTNMKAGVMDGNYRLLARCSGPTLPETGFEDVVARMAELARQALEMAGVEACRVDSVGIGVPSCIDPVTRNLLVTNNLGWHNVNVIDEFSKHWDIAVHVANDADCAALGESVAGAGKDFKSVLMVTLGTGIGGGLVIDNKLWLGGDEAGIEPGHNILVEGGFPCTCGRAGCIEAYCSVTALVRQTIDMMSANRRSLMWEECGRDLNKVNGRTAFDAAKRGDAAGKTVVDNYIRYLAAALSSFVTAYRPHAILIGGGISNEGEYLLAPLRKQLEDNAYYQDVLEPAALLKAELGNDAGLIGAALLGYKGNW